METNEEKAKEIAENQFSWYSDFDDVNSFEECYESAMAMAQWKDEQFAKEKQQLIDNLREVLSAHMHGGEIDEVLAELDEKMKGE